MYQVSNTLINPIYIGLVVLIIVIIIIIIIFMITVYKKISTVQEVAIEDLTQQCDIISSKNPDISALPCCRDLNGQITSRKYIPDFDMVISTVSKPYLSVCSGFCLQGLQADQKTCISSGIGDIEEQQSKFNRCIDLAKPVDCAGETKPVAYQGATRYYAYAAGESLCSSKGPCS